MVKNHLKSIATPRSWRTARKEKVFIIRPKPGRAFRQSIALGVIFRDILGYAKTRRELCSILNNQEVLVDGKRRKSYKFCVGLLDVISIPSIKKNFRILLDKKGKLIVREIKDDEAKIKPEKIVKKTIVKGGKTQLNFFDSKTMLIEKGSYKIGDSVVIEFPWAIKEHVKFEKGAAAYITDGSYVGTAGKITDIKGNVVSIVSGKTKFETKKDFILVIGKEKPLIAVE